MTTALIRQPTSSLVDCEITHINRESINIELALKQHEGYCQALIGLGVEIKRLPPLGAFPDSVFVEDNAIILNELAVLTSMGTASRQSEPHLLFSAISQYRRVVKILPPAKIEGGDVVCVGKTLYVGMSSRTNYLGVEALRAFIDQHGYTLVPISVTKCLHLKSACTPIDAETLLINSSWVDSDSFNRSRLLHISTEEPFAANVLQLPQGIIANGLYPKTIELMTKEGYDVTEVNLSEFSKAESGVTCLSLIIP